MEKLKNREKSSGPENPADSFIFKIGLADVIRLTMFGTLISVSRFVFQMPIGVPGHTSVYWMGLLMLGAGAIASLLFILLIFIVIAVLFSFIPVGLWISALAAGVRVGIFTLIGMRLRRVPPAQIVNPLIKADKAGINISVNQLEAHYLAGGNVDRVVNALIAAERAAIPLLFERAAAIDLADSMVYQAEKTIKDFKDKADPAAVEKLQRATDELKEAVKGGVIETIKAKLEAVTGPLYELTATMYQKTGQEQQPGTGAPGDGQAGGEAPKDNVVDADFEVKDDK
jgi:hypothetical protein